MIGTLIDCVCIAVGGFVGFFAKSNFIDDDTERELKRALAMCAFLVGIVGAISVGNPIICVLSLVNGAFIGNKLRLADKLEVLLNKVSFILGKAQVSDSFIEGFCSYTLLSIAGSMAIVGPIADSLNGELSILLTKSVLDFICAILFASSFGLSVVCSIAVVFPYQGFFAILAIFCSPMLTNAVVADMSAIGSLLIFLMGFNLLGVVNIKTMNFTPAIFLPMIFHWIWQFF